MNRSPKLVELHSLLRKWPWAPNNDAPCQLRQTARALELLDDGEVKQSMQKGGKLTLLHACAKQPNVPLQIPLRLLTLAADPNALSVVRLSDARSAAGPVLKRMDVLASAIYHRAAETQLALLTCPRLQFLNAGAQVQWSEDGHSDGQELVGVWPTQQENHAAHEKQSLWWHDNIDAAFRYILLAREYHVQLASGHSVARGDPASEALTTREWSSKAANVFQCTKSLLAFVEARLSALQPDLLMLVHLLVTEGLDAAKDYAHGRGAGEKPSGVEMAKAILKRVKVNQTPSAHSCAVVEYSELRLTLRLSASLVCFLQADAPPACKEGDAKSDPDETSEERTVAAWAELLEWSELITPAFKHVFSRVEMKLAFGVKLKEDDWASESDVDSDEEDDEEDEDEDEEEKESDEAEEEKKEQATTAERSKQRPADEQDEAKGSSAAADQADEDADMCGGGSDEDEKDEEAEEEQKEETTANATTPSARRGSKRKRDKDDGAGGDALVKEEDQSGQEQGDANTAGSADLLLIDLRPLRQAVTRAHAAMTAVEAALTRCKKKVKRAAETAVKRETIQRALAQKLDEVAQLRRNLAAAQ